NVNNVVSLEVNGSQTRFAVPFDSTGGGFQNDHQTDFNGFINLGWHHQLGDTTSGRTRSDLFAGLFYRRATLRYDADARDQAPFVGTATQLSPRVRLNFYPSTSTTLYLYYGRQFMPTNVEDLRAVTIAAQGGEVSRGTEPERDDFFEAGAIRRFATWGVVTKL